MYNSDERGSGRIYRQELKSTNQSSEKSISVWHGFVSPDCFQSQHGMTINISVWRIVKEVWADGEQFLRNLNALTLLTNYFQMRVETPLLFASI
jgi:hypothetical protein